MTVHKRKKVTKYRGQTTHGGGSMKKRRGAGHRGGRGMGGSGKRADTKKSKTSKIKRYFGMYGFVRKGVFIRQKGMNIGDLDQKIDMYVSRGLAEKKGNIYSIDLEKIKRNKLLAKGETKKEINITAKFASGAAIEKIRKSGGEVTVTETAKNAAEEVPEGSAEETAQDE